MAHNCYYVYFDDIAYYIDANTITDTNKEKIKSGLSLYCAADELKLTECPSMISSYMADECELSGSYNNNAYNAGSAYGSCAIGIAKKYGWHHSAPFIYCPQKI